MLLNLVRIILLSKFVRIKSVHFLSELAVSPIIIFLCLCEMFHIHVKKVTHIKAELNFVCESLSRLKLDDALLVGVYGLSGPTHPSINGAIQNTVSRCRLSQSTSTEKDSLPLWQSTVSHLWKCDLCQYLIFLMSKKYEFSHTVCD